MLSPPRVISEGSDLDNLIPCWLSLRSANISDIWGGEEAQN